MLTTSSSPQPSATTSSSSVCTSGIQRDGKTKTLLPVDFQPTENSVICGNKRSFFCSAGNRRFRLICQMHLDEFMNAPSKHEKSLVVTKVMRLLHETCPIGAFVTLENGRWWEISHRSSREKVGTFFRDCLADKYKSSSKNKVAQRKQKRTQSGSNNPAAPAEPTKTMQPESTTTNTPSSSPSSTKATTMKQVLAARFLPKTGGLAMASSPLFPPTSNHHATATTETTISELLMGSSSSSSLFPPRTNKQALDTQFLPIASVSGPAGSSNHHADLTTITAAHHNHPASAPTTPVASPHAPILVYPASTPNLRSAFTSVLPAVPSSTTTTKPLTASAAVAAAPLPALPQAPRPPTDPAFQAFGLADNDVTVTDELARKVLAELAMTDLGDDHEEEEEEHDMDGSQSSSGAFYDVEDLSLASL